MQFPGQAKPVSGVVFNTSMSRIDSALALALLYGFEGKREGRVGGIAVNGSGLATAAFCDVVCRFYKATGFPVNSNSVLPIGLAADGRTLPPDPAWVEAALTRKNDKGEPAYSRTVRKVTDTAEVPALIRNAITAQFEGMAVVVASAPATSLARMLDLPGSRELITARVKMLIFADAAQDVPAARKLLAEWPTKIVLCPREIGDALPFPADSIEKDFSWATAHPVVDAYRAFKPMPYDAPSWDMAAALYAIHPEAGYFQVSEPGTLQLADDGNVSFTPQPDGKHLRLSADPAQTEKIVKVYREISSAKPVVRAPRVPPKQDAVKTPETKPATK